MRLQRVRPTRLTLVAVLGLFWSLSFGAIREFVWADLREGMIDLRGLSSGARTLVVTGFAFLFLMVGALLFNDLWRLQFPLLASPGNIPGRGQLMPAAIVPLTLFLMALAWSFLLAGALHSHPAIRAGVLLVYLATALRWVGVGSSEIFVPGRAPVWLAWGTLAAILLVFALRWRARARPTLEWAVLFLLVGATFALANQGMVERWRSTGTPFLLYQINTDVMALRLLVVPLLLMIGLDIASFTWRSAGWMAAAMGSRSPQWLLRLLLLLLLGWRLRDVVREALGRVAVSSPAEQTLEYLGAAGFVALVWLLWWIVGRMGRVEGEGLLSVEQVAETAERKAPLLVLADQAIPLVTVLVITIPATILLTLLAATQGEAALAALQRLQSWVAANTARLAGVQSVLLGGVVLLAAFWFARRGRKALALYLAVFSAQILWALATNPGGPLDRLDATGAAPDDFCWVVLLGGIALFWFLRGRLSRARVERLLFLVLVTALLRQTDFIENPFSPFFGFAGIAFIAFGIVWDAMTAGSWANEGSPGLPRVSRIFLYLGYVLMTVSLVNWFLTGHNLAAAADFTGETAMDGLELFGRPMLYALFPVALALLPESVGPAEGPGGPPSP